MGNENTANGTDDYKCLICGESATQGIEVPIAFGGKILTTLRVCRKHPQEEAVKTLLKESQEFIKKHQESQ